MANRWWVGGTAAWDAVVGNKWAAVSGGPGGQPIPTSADAVFFDAASGAVTVTISAGNTGCAGITCTGFAGTLAGATAITVTGGMTLSATTTLTSTGTITFAGSAANTITSAGKVFPCAVTFDGVGGTWTLQDAFSSTLGAVTLTNGTFNTNAKAFTCLTFSSSNANNRTLTITNSTVGCNAWNLATITNLTFNANGSTINVTGNSLGSTFQGGGKVYNILNWTISAAANESSFQGMTGANTFATLTFTGAATKTGRVSFGASITVTGTFTCNGNSLTNRTLLRSDAVGTSRTITAAVVVINNTDFQDITGAGAGVWSGASIGNAEGNSGITFTPTVTRYWTGGTGSWSAVGEWSAASGGAAGASVPLCHDAVIFDANSFSGAGQTVTCDMSRLGKDINFTGILNNPTINLGSSVNGMFGSLTLVAGMTLGGANALTFWGRGANTVTSAGKAFTQNTTLDAPGGSLTLLDAFQNNVRTLTVTRGTFNANNFNLTIGAFDSNNAFVRTITMGSGTWNITLATASTIWAMGTSLNSTVNPGTSTIKIIGSTVNTRTFSGGSKTFNNIWFSNATPGGQLNFVGSNTFNDFKCDTAPQTIKFTAASTTTVTTWTVSGIALNLITIDTITAAAHNLTKAGGGTISSDYLSIINSHALPVNTWYAGTHSVDGGGNTGWIFSDIPNTRSVGGGVAYGSGASY